MLARCLIGLVASSGLILAFGPRAAQAQDPWADAVVSYDLGVGGAPGYTNPLTVLGPPTRYTGQLGGWPSAVTPFNPAWGADEILSLGAGGHLVVKFDEPIRNDPAHPYGVDFLIFGNGFFVDTSWPNGQVGGLFAEGPFVVSVSADGSNFVALTGTFEDALFPTLGYLDLTGPYDPNAGQQPSDFTKPVDPRLTLDDFMDKSFAEVVAIYAGSGGGLPFDIGPTGLGEVHYVRIDVPAGATSPEFDAFAAVPEPSSVVLVLLLALGALDRRVRS